MWDNNKGASNNKGPPLTQSWGLHSYQFLTDKQSKPAATTGLPLEPCLADEGFRYLHNNNNNNNTTKNNNNNIVVKK